MKTGRIFSLMLSLMCTLAYSINSFGLTLQDAFEATLQKNETVPTQEEAVYQADQTVKQAWGSIVPQVNFTTQWMWQQQQPTPNGFSPDWNPLTKLTATQPLFQGFRDWKGLSEAKHLFRQQRVAKDNVELTLYKSLVASYYNILFLEKDIVNLNEEVGFLNDRIKELERWRKIGRAQTTDVLTAKTSLASELVKIEQDTQQLRVARDQFALTTGLPAESQLTDHLHEFHPTLEALDSYLGKIKDRPDVRSEKEAVAAAEDNINVQKANHLPSLALTADRYFLRAGVQQNVDWDAMLVLTIPIFAGGVTQSKVRQAYSQDRQAELALSLSQRSADQEIRQYYDSTASDLKQLALNKENEKLSEETFKEEQKFFRNGLVTNLDVLTALTNFIEAKRTYDQNKFQLRSDYLRLTAAVAANKTTL